MTNMNKQTEALKLAEDALKRVRTQDMELVQMSMIALAAIREALTSVPDWASEAIEQPAPMAKPRKQEPVAWMYQCSADSSGPVLMQNKRDWAESSSGLWTETPLYKSPTSTAKQAADG